MLTHLSACEAPALERLDHEDFSLNSSSTSTASLKEPWKNCKTLRAPFCLRWSEVAQLDLDCDCPFLLNHSGGVAT